LIKQPSVKEVITKSSTVKSDLTDMLSGIVGTVAKLGSLASFASN
jgi:hypothetical protein